MDRDEDPGARFVLRVRRPGRDLEPAEVPLDRPLVLVGRDAACDVVLDDDVVSAVHARITRRPDGLAIDDAGSTNGTRLDGAALGGAPAPLRLGSVVRIGPFELTVIEGRPPAATASLALRLGRELGAPRLVVEDGPDAGEELVIAEPGDVVLIGRGEECRLRLRDPDVSRAHVEVRRDWTGAVARDLGSKNGARLGEAPLEGEVALRDGDVLWLGRTRVRFVHAARPAGEPPPSSAAPPPATPPPRRPAPVVPLVVGALAIVGALVLGWLLLS